MQNFVPTISVIVTILLVGLALASLIHSSRIRLENRIENRIVAVENRIAAVENRLLGLEKAMARIGGLLEGLGLVGQTKPPEEG